MGQADYWAPGEWNARCSMCGFKRKSGTLVKNWQGMWRCPIHNEPRQSQDFVRGVPDIQTPPWTQPIGGDVFVNVCSPNSMSAIPGYMEPSCVTPNNISPFNTIPHVPPNP